MMRYKIFLTGYCNSDGITYNRELCAPFAGLDDINKAYRERTIANKLFPELDYFVEEIEANNEV